MRVMSLSTSSLPGPGPTSRRRNGLRLTRRTAAVAAIIGASCIAAARSDSKAERAGKLFDRRNAAIHGFLKRIHNGAPLYRFSTDLLLTASSGGFLGHSAVAMSLKDRTLAPVMMRNVFMMNILAWGALAHRSCYEANEGRTLAVFAASYASQTAARCALSLAPMAAPWRMVSGGVFGLLGAKVVYDIRHRRSPVLSRIWMECTGDGVEPPGNGHPNVMTTETGSFMDLLNHPECISHTACAAAACVMPTHPWCKAAAFAGGALTAYLLGPHWILCRSRCRTSLTDCNSSLNVVGYNHIHDYVENRPLVPWFAFPPDPRVPEDMIPGEIATGANTFIGMAARAQRRMCMGDQT